MLMTSCIAPTTLNGKCDICGIAKQFEDTDDRQGHILGSITFGPAMRNCTVDQSQITEYRVQIVDRIGRALSTVSVLPAVSSSLIDCCSHDLYTAEVSTFLPAASERFAIRAVLDGQECATGTLTAPIRDLVAIRPGLNRTRTVVGQVIEVPPETTTQPSTEYIARSEPGLPSEASFNGILLSSTLVPCVILACCAGWGVAIYRRPVRYQDKNTHRLKPYVLQEQEMDAQCRERSWTAALPSGFGPQAQGIKSSHQEQPSERFVAMPGHEEFHTIYPDVESLPLSPR